MLLMTDEDLALAIQKVQSLGEAIRNNVEQVMIRQARHH